MLIMESWEDQLTDKGMTLYFPGGTGEGEVDTTRRDAFTFQSDAQMCVTACTQVPS